MDAITAIVARLAEINSMRATIGIDAMGYGSDGQRAISLHQGPVISQ